MHKAGEFFCTMSKFPKASRDCGRLGSKGAIPSMPMSLLGILFVGLHLFSSTAQAVVPYHAAHSHNDLADLSTENVEVQMNSRVVITTNTTVVETSGQWVELSWCCVPNPAKDDWIGLYAPGDADPMLYSPAVRWIVGGVDGYMESGAGSLRSGL